MQAKLEKIIALESELDTKISAYGQSHDEIMSNYRQKANAEIVEMYKTLDAEHSQALSEIEAAINVHSDTLYAEKAEHAKHLEALYTKKFESAKTEMIEEMMKHGNR